MRKQTKLVAVLSAAALLAIGASMTSFAAKGWGEEGGQWYYYNNDGDYVQNDWKKSGNNWFYLGDDGTMMTDSLVEDGNYYYYVNANGAMVTNSWVAVEPDDDAYEDDVPDHYWYYFGSNGKAYKAGSNNGISIKTINGKKYVFDEKGRMQSGLQLLDSNKGLVGTGDVEDANGDITPDSIKSSEGSDFLYYFGDEETDGSMKTGKSIKVALDDGDTYTFGFDKAGKGYNGVVDKNKIYKSGLLLTASSDYNYQALSNDFDTASVGEASEVVLPETADVKALTGRDNYVVSKSGSIVKDGSYVKDAEDNYYAVSKAADNKGAVAFFFYDDEYARNKAQDFARNGKVIGCEKNDRWDADCQ